MELLARRDFKGAERHFAYAISLNPEIKFYYNNIAVALMNQKNYSDAVDNLEKAILLDPFYTRALSNLAISYFHLSCYRQAFYYYQRASKADRPYTEKRFDLKKIVSGMEKLHRGNPKDATLKSILNRVRNIESLP